MAFPSLFTTIPEGEIALVTYANGHRKEVAGPQRIFNRPGTDVEPYSRYVLLDHEGATVYDADGKAEDVIGPRVVHVSPLGQYVHHRTFSLQPHEAMVVVDLDGKPTIYVGTGYKGPEASTSGIDIKRAAQVVVKGRETVHKFKWTGSKGDTEYKAPGTLEFEKLRLQETQTWFAVDTRTKDGVTLRINLMLFITFKDVHKLLRNDDPLGVLFNLVTAEILKTIGDTSFDDFRKNPSGIVAEPAGLSGDKQKTARDKLEDLGVSIDNASLRLWGPTDAGVDRLMAQEASTTASKAVNEAAHSARMQDIANEGKQLEEQAKNLEKRQALAKGEGTQAATKVKAFIAELRQDQLFAEDAEGLRRLVLLRGTAEAAQGGLTLSTEAFTGSRRMAPNPLPRNGGKQRPQQTN